MAKFTPVGSRLREIVNMTFRVIVRDRATQDLRQQANYILAMGNRDAAEKFLESAEYTFNQLATTPNIDKICN